jgi:hypothetical protein
MSRIRISQLFTRSIILLLVVLTITSLAQAQVTTGNLQGLVLDQNRAAVAGAAVRVINNATGIARETTTNQEGFYRVTNLVPGDKYSVEVVAQGFSPATLNNVAVRLATENSADVSLAVGEVSGNVVVTDEQVLIEGTQSQLSQSYTPKQLTQLPFNGGSIDNLALLTPGVVTPGDTDFANGTGISANGNRGRSNNFQIDGQDNNDNSVSGPTLTLTNTEAIGEFQVITNSFSAEFGRNSGAQINTITKPGTNEFHGTLFEYHNNQALDSLTNLQKVNAGGFKFLRDSGFSQFSGLTARNGEDPFRNNKFGGAIGGPIKKKKAFFFLTYQGTYLRGEAVANGLNSGPSLTFDRASALLAAQLFPNPATAALTSSGVGGGPAFVQGQGVFLLAPPVVDINGDGIPDSFLYGPGNPAGNDVTANRLAPSVVVRDAAGNLRVLYAGEPVRVLPTNSSVNEIITREDFSLTSKDALSVRYIFNNADFPVAAGRALAGAMFDVPSRNHNVGVTYTRMLGPNMVNEARFNYSNLYVRFGDPNGPLPGPQIGFSGQRDYIGNFTSLVFGAQNVFPQDRKVVVYQEQDTISATVGNHALKFGVDLRQQRTANFFLPNFLGTYTFRGGSNAGVLPANTFFDFAGNPRAGQAFAFENLILNRPRDINFAIGSPRRNIDQDDYFFFVQDDWRIHPTLTLNLGLRYEVSTQPFNPLIEKLNAREADPSTAIFSAAFPLSTRTLTKLPIDKNNIGPRVGFAWSPNLNFLGDRFANGRTVIRGGFGIAYDPSFFNIVNNTVTASPFVGTGSIRQNNPALPGSIGIPFLPNTQAQLNLTPGTSGGDPRLFNQTRVAPDFRNPYTMSYNFGIQQEVWKNSVFEARYVGSRIVGQFQSVNANPDLRWLERAGCALAPAGTDPNICGGRFTGGVVRTVAAILPGGADRFDTRPGTNGNGRLDSLFGPARERLNGASGTYNGMQLRFDTRFANSLALSANYTLSKTIDNASEIFASFAGGQAIAFAQNPFDITAGERGLSAFHQKHNFTANFIYDFPWNKEQRGFSGKLLGGYQVSGVVFLGSGRPYTIQNAFGSYDPTFDLAFSGAFGPVRPFNGNPNAPSGTIAFGAASAAIILGDGRGNPGEYIIYNTLNPGSNGIVVANGAAALQQARVIYNDFATYTALGGALPFTDFETASLFGTPFGDVGRSTFSGLPFYQVNLALFKTTNLTERTKLEFRVEAANLLNHRNFGVPLNFTEFAWAPFGNGTVGAVGPYQNPGFNVGANRSVRLGLRLLF